jgi:hypothetical protein
MTLLIALAATAIYLMAGLYVARWFYGRWRRRGIDHRAEDRLLYRSTAEAIDAWNDIDRPMAMAGALVASLVWPLSLVVGWLAIHAARFLNATPVLSQAEMRDRLAERDRHIADLERQLGIGAS